jgi:sodium transport system permease protein
MIRTLLIVLWKEVRETARDRRSIVTSIITGPILIPFLFAGAMTFSLKQSIAELDEVVSITVAGERNAPNLVQFLRENAIAVTLREGDDAAVRSWIAADPSLAVLMIPKEYGEKFRASRPARVMVYADGSKNEAEKKTRRLGKVLAGYSSMIGALRLQVRGVSPSVAQAVVVDEVDVSTPSARATLVLGMLGYVILFVTLMGGMYLAIDATAGERERGSLEPLLTMPVPREHLIYGKVLGAATFMALALTLVTLSISQALRMIPLEVVGMTANFGPDVAVGVWTGTLPIVLLGAAVLTIVASFTRSYKEAQTWIGIVMLVPTLPILVAGIMNVKASLPLMLIPSMSQHLIIQGLLRGEPLPVHYLVVSAASTLAVGVMLTWVAGRLYRRESILG